MPIAGDISQARMLLERAERESDPEQETRHIEEALLLLETADDSTQEEKKLIANLRTSYARRLLTQMPKLKSVSFEVWLFYFNVLVTLASEVEALTTADSTLAANRQEFVSMWGPDALAAMQNAMNTELPPVIAAFFQAHNTGQTDDFDQLFTGDAIVSDESHEYRGAGIKGWIDGAIAKYKPIADVTGLTEVGEQTIATAQVSGSFPGSPAQIRYKFTLRDGKIAALAIGA